MKKVLIIFILLLFANFANATTVLYRISSGEVLGISQSNDNFNMQMSYGRAVITDPTFIDGINILDSNEDSRVLGYAKVKDGNTIRNATQVEIDSFETYEREDELIVEERIARNYFVNNNKLRRILIALLDILVDEINTLRAEHGLPDRTLEQAKTAVINRISKDD